MSKKRFVIDTNVILYDPNSVFNFGDNEVIIPITVIEELDKHKTDQRETGMNARHFFKFFDSYLDGEDIKKGMVINALGGTLRTDVRYSIEVPGVDLPLDYNFDANSGADRSSINDNRIMNCAYINDAIIVTNDRALRFKAAAYGMPNQIYKTDRIEVDDYYTGWVQIHVDTEVIDTIYKDRKIDAVRYEEGLYPNAFVLLVDKCNEKNSALTRYNSIMKEFNLISTDGKVMGIEARNMEQDFAFDALLDPNIEIVCLLGKAGCGKSLAAIAAGLQQVTQTNDKLYNKLLVYRPIVPMGNDIGYLPGTKEEKLGPWMQAISDNIDFIMSDSQAEDRPKIKAPKGQRQKKDPSTDKHDIPFLDEKGVGKVSKTQELIQFGFLELEATTYARGRTIPNVFLIIDEGQNLTPHEMKTIITRAGEGTKIVITGDPSQIDSPYLDSTNNGLSYVAERCKHYDHAAIIKFSKSERSRLAEWAANTL
ncbi:MAG TPA: PhoH family protein [Clostridia bacterium]